MPRALRLLAGAFLAVALTATGALPATLSPASANQTDDHGIVSPDEIYYWNDVLLEAFRRQGGGPGPLARAAAMMHAGIFDTLNSARWSRHPLGTGYHGYTGIVRVDNPPKHDGQESARAATALLSAALPDQAAFVQQKFVERYGNLTSDPHLITQAVIGRILAGREGDGSGDTTPYPFGNEPGAWQLTGGPTCNSPTGPSGPVTPNWGRVRPFTMTSNTQFRQDHPAGASNYQELLSSSLYAADFNEVKSLGRFDSTTRTPEQTDIGFFWGNDLPGTYSPIGQLLDTLRDFTIARGITDPVELSRVYALASLALGDAGIAAWNHKYDTVIDLWRPQTAIRQAALDGNPVTAPDPAWLPLLALAPPSTTRINPCFPAWVSGHATFAAAWAGVMANEFGDATTVTVGSEDPRALGDTRTFSSFSDAAVESAESRIYLGVHYRFDADDGLATGFGLADHVHDNFLTERCTAFCDQPSGQLQLPAGGSVAAV